MWRMATPRKHRGIPQGTGQYVVGCSDIMTGFSTEGSFLRLYYPSAVTSGGATIETSNKPLWLPRREYSDGYANFIKITSGIMKSLFHWFIASYRVPAYWKGPLLPNQVKSSLPVVVFTHGLGANRTTYTSICLDLASQGFVVAAVEHRDQSASATYYVHPSDVGDKDGHELVEQWIPYERPVPGEDEFPLRNKQVHQRAEECQKALNLLEKLNRGESVTNLLDRHSNHLEQFKGRFDLNRVAVAGHSFGGATSVQTLEKDSRFKCAVAMDIWMVPLEKTLAPSIKQPILFINTESFQWPGNIARMKRYIPDDVDQSERKMITILGTVHQSQADFSILLNAVLGKLFKCRGPLDPHVAMEINNRASLAFLCKFLDLEYDSKYDALLDGKHDHVIPGTNVKLDPNYKTKSGL
ncbi:platelet-activating factor acetylhydrolase-like [Glandiceps talaboti]